MPSPGRGKAVPSAPVGTKNNFTVDDTVNGNTVRQSKWVDWNRYVDELSFAQAFRTKLVSVGFNSVSAC